MGSLQREDFKSEAELIAAGGAKSQLLNDTEIYVTAKGINETLDDAITLGKIGGGGSGGINYITNSEIASNVNGYLAYADAAGIMPVDGTGGSPTVTITRNTTTPLRGTGDAKISKPASDCQGQGVSYDFPIDLADATQPAKVSFSYRATANFSFANEDLRIWIYDKDAPELIPVTPYQMDGSGKFVGEFQFNASTSNDYRVIFHIATTNANAWDFYFDDLMVGPSSGQSSGMAGTDWIAYTPTGSWTTNCTYLGFWKRVGDTAHYQVNVALSGAPTSTDLIVNLPAGHVINTAKMVNFTKYAQSLGNIVVRDNNTGGDTLGYVYYNSNTSVGATCLRVDSTYAGENTVTQSVPVTFASADSVQMEFTVPIVNWSSNVIVSDGSDTRVVTCAYNGIATGTLSGSFNTMTCPTKIKDTHGMYSGGVATIKIAGDYDVSMYTQIGGTYTIGSSLIGIAIYINGTGAYTKYITANRSNSNTAEFVQLGIPLNVNDTVEIKIYCDATGPTYENTADRHAITIKRSPGPATMAASEFVAASYYMSGNATVNANTALNFDAKDYDTHDYVTTGAGVWKFSPRIPGVYSVNGTLRSNVADNLILYKNGSAHKNLNIIPSGAPSPFGTDVKLAVGDYIHIVQIATATFNGGSLDGANTGIINIAKLS
jgi:hypothetical protein